MHPQIVVGIIGEGGSGIVKEPLKASDSNGRVGDEGDRALRGEVSAPEDVKGSVEFSTWDSLVRAWERDREGPMAVQ